MATRQLLNLRLIGFSNPRHNQVLIGSETKITTVNAGNGRQTGFQRLLRIIQNPSIFDIQRQMPFAINALHPTDAIAASGKRILA